MKHSMPQLQLLKVALQLPGSDHDTHYVLSSLLEQSFSPRDFSKASDALSIALMLAIPGLRKTIRDVHKNLQVQPDILNINRQEVITFDFTDRSRDVFWQTFNDKIR